MSVRSPLAGLFAVAALLFAVPGAYAADVVVDDDGAQCATPHDTVAEGVAAAVDGDTLYICAGEYEVGASTATAGDNLLDIDKSIDVVGAGAGLVTITPDPDVPAINDADDLFDLPSDGGHIIAVTAGQTVNLSGVTVDSGDTQVDSGVAFVDGQGSFTNSRVFRTATSARAGNVDTGAAVVATAVGVGGESTVTVDGVLLEDYGIAGVAAVSRVGGTRTLQVNVSDSRLIGAGEQDEHLQLGAAAAQETLAPAVDVDISDSLLVANTNDGFYVEGLVPEEASVTGSAFERNGTGVNNTSLVPVDATGNWWGDPDGAAEGDGTSSGVDSSNHLTAPPLIDPAPAPQSFASPSVTVTAPADNALLQPGQAQTVTANAPRTLGGFPVRQVVFRRGTDVLATDTSAPYSATYTPTTAQAGTSQTLTAEVTDGLGRTTQQSVSVRIADAPPTVSIDAPADGATIPHGSATSITATATDDVGIQSVTFRRGTAVLATDTSAPYSITYTPTTAQAGTSQTLTAVVTDSNGQTAQHSVSVRIADAPPAVTIDSPADGATIPREGATTIEATATDDVSVESVTFRRGTEVVAVDDSAPYSATYTPTAAQAGTSQVLIATVTDGGQTTTDAIEVQVQSAPQPTTPGQQRPEDRPPRVAFTSPASGTAIDPRALPRLTASASDDNGVASVAFLDDGRVVCVDSAAPFDCAYQPTGDDVGRNTLIAIARDRAGQTAVDFRAIRLGKFTPAGITARTTPKRDRRRPYRYRTRGRLTLPAGVTPAQACAAGGTVQVQYRAGRLRLPLIATVRPDCSFSTSIVFPSRRPLGRRGRLAITTVFAGNDVLAPARAKKQRVRAG